MFFVDKYYRKYFLERRNMHKSKIILLLAALMTFSIVMGLGFVGCLKVYPESERVGEEPPPEEEHRGEEPPPEEEPEPSGGQNSQNNNQQQSNLSEEEIKRRVFNAAQYEIEHNSIYQNVVFDTKYDPNFMNKVTGYDYKYECGLEFEALDTNVGKQGKFVWIFVVSYDPDTDKCYVETGSMQSEFWL
jgi:hypothetical protein